MTRKHVLVTGGNGYIGSLLVPRLMDAGYKVSVVDWMVFGHGPLRRFYGRANFRLIEADIRTLDSVVLEGVDTVFDLAAIANDPLGLLHPELTFEINHLARARLATLAKDAGVSRYLLASSCSVYGAAEGIVDESSTPNPLTPYAQSSIQGEFELHDRSGGAFTTTAVRNATAFGLSPRMRFDSVVGMMTLGAFRDGTITVNGDGDQRRPFVHASDIADAMMLLAAAPKALVDGETFNLGHCNTSIRRLAELVRVHGPSPAEIRFEGNSPDQRDYAVSFDKLTRRIGWQPPRSLGFGIAEIHKALAVGRVADGPLGHTVALYQKALQAGTVIETVYGKPAFAMAASAGARTAA